MSEMMSQALETNERPIAIEEFSRERTNNFYLYFVPGQFCDEIYRKKSHYQKFAVEHPDLAEALQNVYNYMKEEEHISLNPSSPPEVKSEFIRRGQQKSALFEEHKQDFYNAYLAMRKHVKNDQELFS